MRHLKSLFIFIILAVSACTESNENSNEKVPILPDYSIEIERNLNNYAANLSLSTEKNIFDPVVTKEGKGNYIIEFQTSDPNLMIQDADKDPQAYDRNNAMNYAWEIKFCSPELKSIISNYNITMIKGYILDIKQKFSSKFLARQAIAWCNGSTAKTTELMDKEIQGNLNNLQRNVEGLNSLKH